MKPSPALLAASLALLTGCTNLRTTYPTTADCIHDQFFTRITVPTGRSSLVSPPKTTGPAIFAQTLLACGDPVPDLTGDTMMQAVAILYNVKFRVDIARDTRLKTSADGQLTTTGSLIPLPALIFHKS